MCEGHPRTSTASERVTYGGNDDKIKFNSEQCELGDCSKIHIFYGDQSDEDMLDDMIRQRPDGWDIPTFL